jgi:glycosyltransferase involved in cell wall biosynthesis
MKVTGFTFIRNAIVNDYPVGEAILSVLPLCDEFIVALGNSTDETAALIQNLAPAKIKIINTVWDDSLRAGGQVFALETDKAIAEISKDTDWMIYIQGDEVLHEKYHELIKEEMAATLQDQNIEALLLKYKHFYGSYDYYAESRRWYRREIRILKNLPGIHSYKDAQGFRIDGRKLQVKLIDAYIYHYGWVKTPAALQGKVRNFNQFYQTADWVEENFPVQQSFDLRNADRLVKFTETHPAVIARRIAATNWKFEEDITRMTPKMNFRRKLLQKVEDLTGVRLFEYRNYKIVKSSS